MALYSLSCLRPTWGVSGSSWPRWKQTSEDGVRLAPVTRHAGHRLGLSMALKQMLAEWLRGDQYSCGSRQCPQLPVCCPSPMKMLIPGQAGSCPRALPYLILCSISGEASCPGPHCRVHLKSHLVQPSFPDSSPRGTGTGFGSPCDLLILGTQPAISGELTKNATCRFPSPSDPRTASFFVYFFGGHQHVPL